MHFQNSMNSIRKLMKLEVSSFIWKQIHMKKHPINCNNILENIYAVKKNV